MDFDDVLRRRLAVQHLTGPSVGVADYVAEAVAIQAQDPGTARWSLGMRTGLTDACVRAAQDAGAMVRLHVLRPTWHFVAPGDLRWLVELTGVRTLRTQAKRHRDLGLTDPVVERAFGTLQRELAGGTCLTRRELQPMMLTRVEVEGVEPWFDPSIPGKTGGSQVYLLPAFDEAYLSYLAPNFPRSPGHPAGNRPVSFAEAGGGLMIAGLREVGNWRRQLVRGRLSINVYVDAAIPASGKEQIDSAAHGLAWLHESEEPQISLISS